MMSQLLSLEKILDIKDNEKQAAQVKHFQSVEAFEKVALELYHLLKKRELAEEQLHTTLQESITVTELQEQSLYIERLTDEVFTLQEMVDEARQLMNLHKEDLADKHIEFKKIEKIINHRYEIIKLEEQKAENNLMDELSIQQYLSQKNGELL